MTPADAVALSLGALLGGGMLLFFAHCLIESAEHKLWPRGLRWLPGAWLDTAEKLHRCVLRAFWPEKLPGYRGRALLRLEALDQAWRCWAPTSDGNIPLWNGRWAPRPRPACPCGYGSECAVHCGNGHETGACPDGGVLHEHP